MEKQFPQLKSLYELSQEAREADVVEQVQSAPRINIEVTEEYVIYNGRKSGGIEKLPLKMRNKICNLGRQLPKFRIVVPLRYIEELVLNQLVKNFARTKPERSLNYVQSI